MTTADRFIHSALASQPDVVFDAPLRPQSLDEFIGQDAIRERLDVLLGAAKQRGEVIGHCLFSGPPGLGKTTLAHILSKAMGTQLIVTSGPVLEKAGDLAGLLTTLGRGDILFIDEIHRLSRSIEEYLYSAMEDFSLDLVIDSGPHARSVRVNLNPFTLVGATTRLGLLTEPLRTRFAFTCRLNYYDPEVLQQIVQRTARLLEMTLDASSALAIAKRARGTPRIANHLLRWVRDYSQMRTNHQINEQIVVDALHMLDIDDRGLDEMDKRVLRVILDHYEGGPVGLNAIAAALGEEPSTIEEVYEPYLIKEGFLRRTSRGREVTTATYQHFQLQRC